MVGSQPWQVEARHSVSNRVACALMHATPAHGRKDSGCATHFARCLRDAAMQFLDVYRLVEIEIGQLDNALWGISQSVGGIRLLDHADKRHEYDRKQRCLARDVKFGDHNVLPMTRNTALWEITETRGGSRHAPGAFI